MKVVEREADATTDAGAAAEPALVNRKVGPWDLAAVLVLLLATLLRTARLNDVQYRYDDDALYTFIMAMVRTGQPVFHGLTSTIALPNGPFQVYLLAPFGWINASPALMTVGVAFLNILAVAAVYGFARDFFGRRVGLLALLLVAVNPWATVLSRRMLGNDMVAPFAALSLWALARWLFRRDARAAIVAGAALAIAGQVYVIGLECLAPAITALAMAGKRYRSWSAILGLLVFALLMAPYVWTQAVPQLGRVLYIHGQPSGLSATFDFSAIGFALEMASNEGYQAYAAQAGGVLDATGGLPGAFGLLGRALYLLGIGVGAWTLARGPGKLRDQQRGIHALLLTAFVVPVALLLRPAILVRVLYLVATFPLPYLYGALALDRLWTWSGHLGPAIRRAARGALAAAVGGTVVLDLALAAVFFGVIGQYWSQSDYGIPWGLNDATARESIRLAQQNGAQRILTLDDASDFNMLDWVLAEGRPNVGDFDDTRLLVLPGQPTLYVAPADQPAQRTLRSDYSQYLLRQDRWPGDGTTIRYYLLPSSTAGAPLPAGAIPLNWTAGGLIRFDGVVAPRRVRPGERIGVQVIMTILRQPGPMAPDFSVFAHLLDAGGAAIAKQDQPTFRTRFWLPGDRVLQTFTLPVPANTASGLLSLAIGAYSTDQRGVTITPLELTDAHGARLGAARTLPMGVVPPSNAPAPSHPLPVRFGDGIALDGYDLSQTGATLTVTAHWSASAPPARDETAFVHVLAADGKLVAQDDAPPLAGRFPTSYWLAGDRIADPHRIALPSGLPPGTYQLAFGLYDSRTQAPVPVVSGRAETELQLPATP